MIDIENIDKNVDPGTDFYKYAIGNWLINNPIPEEYSSYGSFHVLHEENQEQLKKLFQELSNKEANNANEAKIAAFYASGMNEGRIENEGIKGLLPELEKFEEINNLEHLMKHTGYLHSIGIRPFFSLFADQDEKNSEYIIAQLCQGGLGMPDKDYYMKDDKGFQEIQLKYRILISRMFQLAGIEEKESNKIAKSIYDFEKELAINSMSRVDMRDPHKTYNKTSFAEFNEIYTDLEFEFYLKGHEIAPFEEINVRQADFFKGLINIIENTNISILRNYLKWNMLRSVSSFISSDFVNENFNFYGKVLSGSEKLQERWKRVVAATNDAMGEAIGQIYVEKHFPLTAKERITELVENIRVSMAERIEGATWMQSETKIKALDKLHAMKLKVGYPDKWIDYSDLEIRNDSFVHNILRGRRFNIKREMNKIGKKADQQEWHMYPQTVNAYYNPTMNEIVFPAAILQPPFFDYTADDAVNYGAIGSVIAHEITHGFDDKGRLYDKNGNLNEWWTDEDKENFNKEASKLVELYNIFEPISGSFINGDLTLGENIADLGGVTIALNALKKKLNGSNPNDNTITSIDSIKRFFLSYANVWKQNMRDEELRKRLLIDVHSPAEYRVNGIVYHLPDFYHAFELEANKEIETGMIKIW